MLGRRRNIAGIGLTCVIRAYATDNSIGRRIDGSSFPGLVTRVEIGHIRIGTAGYGRSKSCGWGSSLSQRT